jgi:hypothetical protein
VRHPLDAIVLHDDRTQHAFGSEARGDSFEHQGQALAGLLRFGKQCRALLFQRLDVDGDQFEVADRRTQLDLGKVLSEQPGEVLDVARRLRRANHHLAALARRLGAHRVMPPAQREGGDAAVPRREPSRHLQHQPPRAEEHRRRKFHPGHQFDLRAEGVRKFDPSMSLRSQAVGLVEGAQQFGIEPSAEAAAWQLAHVAQSPASESNQCRVVQGHRCQGLGRKGVEQLLDGLRKAVGLACPGEGNRSEAGRRPTQLAHAKVSDFFTHALDKLAFAAEQANAGLDLHHDGGQLRCRFDDSDARCELKAPGRESRDRVSAP